MPNITIYEQDLTDVSALSIVNNAAYIPGYSNIGPINEPTLVTTVSQFKNLFGDTPYIFKESQQWPSGYGDGDFAYAGTYEKSYIYAIEILNKGLPIYFERLMKQSEITSWTTKVELSAADTNENEKFIIKAKNPGKSYENMSVTILKRGNEYRLDIFMGTKQIERIDFSLEIASDKYYGKLTSNYIEFPETVYTHVLANVLTKVNFVLDSPLATDEFTVLGMYDLMTGYGTTENIFDKLVDRDMYRLQFITTGSYPVYGLVKPIVGGKNFQQSTNLTEVLVNTAGTRGDAVALVDYNMYKSTGEFNKVLDVHNELEFDTSLQELLVGSTNKEETASKYGTMLAPWATYKTSLLNMNIILPASYAYLSLFATSVKTNPSYYAIAGVTRGKVTEMVQQVEVISGAKAEALQKGLMSISPITMILPYGYCIWGNRTLHTNNLDDNELVASSLMNIRILSNDIKKILYQSAKELTFEHNNELLWLNYRSKVEPDLDTMIARNGITRYELKRKDLLQRAMIEMVIRVYVVEPVEDFDIKVELTDSYVSIQ